MSLAHPSDSRTLASAVADSLVIAADSQARESSVFYWERGLTYTRAVVEAARVVEDFGVAKLADALMADTRSPAAYAALHSALVPLAATPPTPALS